MFKQKSLPWRQACLSSRQAGKIYIALMLIFIISGCLFLSNSVQAQDPPAVDDPLPVLENPLGKRDLGVIIGGIIQYILGFVGILALVMLIYGGITWMTSAGAPEKIKKGRDTLVWAVLGLALVFFSYAILDFIIDALLAGSAG